MRSGVRATLIDNGAFIFIPASTFATAKDDVEFKSAIGVITAHGNVALKLGDTIDIRIIDINKATRSIVGAPLVGLQGVVLRILHKMADKKISYKENYLIMFGHMADDMCQGALPAILTFMYQEGKLNSYADIAYLTTATTIINAIAQPITGYLSDKKPRPYIMTVGMLIAALGTMFLGFMDSMLFMIIAVAVNGLGVAIFHPSAGKLANVFAGKNVGKGMSIFSVGGNIGYAIGPVYFTLFYSFMGLSASVMIMLPAAIMAIIFSMRSRRYNVYSRKAEIRRINKIKSGDAKENYAGTFILLLLVFARYAAMFSLTTFLPLYFISILDVSDKI